MWTSEVGADVRTEQNLRKIFKLMNLCYQDTAVTKTVDRCPLLNWTGIAQQCPSARNNRCSCCCKEWIVRVLLSLQEKSARSSRVTFSENSKLCLSRAGSTHITSSSSRAAGLLAPSREVAKLSSGMAACENRQDDRTEALQQKQKCRLYKHNV